MSAHAVIDLKALQHNYNILSRTLGSVICVLKANAYGHGMNECGAALAKYGADRFAVADIEEALALRAYLRSQGNVGQNILILGYTSPEYAAILEKNRFIQTVISSPYAEALKATGARIRTHIKLDTGMNRVGVPVMRKGDNGNVADGGELKRLARVYKSSRLTAEGVYTHFSCADRADTVSRDFTKKQFERYLNAVSELEGCGIIPKTKHVCNTAAALLYPEMRLDASRIGLALYGMLPSPELPDHGLLPVMSFRAPIVHIHAADPGENVGYGGDHVCKRRTYIATVAAGYGDGFFRRYAAFASPILLDCGMASRVIGNVCMDQLMLDVTDAVESGCNVRVGSSVELFSASASAKNSIGELARLSGDICYEVTAAIPPRTPHTFI